MGILGWIVDGKKYAVKTQALLAAHELCLQEKLDPAKHIWGKIYYHCYDDSWTNVSETEIPFFDLCMLRARQIRDKHSFFRLWYSGGVDSHTALLAFVAAGCPPDEIAIVKGSSFGDTEADHEITQGAIPWLKKNNLYKKVKFYDLGDEFWKKSYDPNEDWVLKRGVMNLRPLNVNLLQNFGMVGKGANVMGFEKPLVYKIKGEWYMAMLDSSGDWIGDVPEFEGFYISPDLPELHIKQAKLLCRWAESKGDIQQALGDYSSNTMLWERNRAIGRLDSASVHCEQAIWKTTARSGNMTWKQQKLYNVYKENKSSVVGHYDDVMRHWHNKYEYLMNDNSIYSHMKGIWGVWINLETGKKYKVDQLFPNGFNIGTAGL
jgi:hypothetical protein